MCKCDECENVLMLRHAYGTQINMINKCVNVIECANVEMP